MRGLFARFESGGMFLGMLYLSWALLLLPFRLAGWGYRQASSARQRREGWQREL